MIRRLLIFAFFILFNAVVTLAASSWQQMADFGAEGRHRGAGFSIGNKGYMGLGHYNGTGLNIVKKDWWEYDPASNSWTQKADYIGNNGNGNYGVLTFSMDNAGYICGGQQSLNSESYKYTPSTNTWTSVAAPPSTPQNTSGFVINNEGYYIEFNQLWKYSPTTDSWSFLGTAPFNVSSWNSTFTLNDHGYVKTSSGLWEYKPSTNQWISRAVFPGNATGGSASFVQNGLGFIVGGYGFGLSDVNSEVWSFNPGTNEWRLESEFLGTSRRFSASFNIGNRAFLGTGTNGTNFNDFWEFDQIADLEQLDNISVSTYPNPVMDVVHFDFNELSNGTLILYNSIGQEVIKREFNQSKISIDRQGLKSGIYYYVIESNDKEVYSNKLIFQ